MFPFIRSGTISRAPFGPGCTLSWERPIARTGHLAQTIRRERVDLVFDHCYLATLDAAVAARQAGVPRISVCVGDPLAEVRQYAGGNVEAAIGIARSAYATADRVIAVSHGIRQRLIEDLGIPGDSVVVHFNMLDVDAARRLSMSHDPCFAPDRSHILTVARLSAEKGHRDMLAALELLVRDRGRREILWHFVGDGPLKVELEADVSSRRLNEYVDFAGFQENPYPFYRHADLFCLASIYEGFGCVLMEALACDLPVVSTDCPSGPREVLDGGKYGKLVPPGDPRAGHGNRRRAGESGGGAGAGERGSGIRRQHVFLRSRPYQAGTTLPDRGRGTSQRRLPRPDSSLIIVRAASPQFRQSLR